MRSCIRTLEGICFRLLAGLLLPNRQRRHQRSVREAAHHARRVGDCVVSRLWIHRPWKRRLPVTASGEVVLIFRIRERIIGKEQGTCSFWLRPWTSKTRMLMCLHVSITTDMLVCICNTVWQWFFGRVSTTATTTFLFIKKACETLDYLKCEVSQSTQCIHANTSFIFTTVTWRVKQRTL